MNLVISSFFIINLFLGVCRAEPNKYFEIDKQNFIAFKIKKPLSTEASFGSALIAGGFLKKNEKH